MKYKTNKYKVTLMILAALVLFSGCQLALEDGASNKSEDLLVGMFVTTEYLDLFDFESYLNDNINSISGGEITIDGNAEGYQGRVYATLITKTLTSDETGEPFETQEYSFTGLEGIPYFTAKIRFGEGEYDSYITTISDEAICSEGMHVFVGDEENKTSTEGTIYVSPAMSERTYYFNPVYQSADGSVYLTSGGGFMTGGWSMSEGEMYSQTMDASTTITENGKAKTESTSIKIAISVMYEPERVAVIEMGSDGELVSRMEFKPGELPETLTPAKETEYLIIETHKHDAEGNPTISREICGKDAESFETFRVRQDGICVKGLTQVNW